MSPIQVLTNLQGGMSPSQAGMTAPTPVIVQNNQLGCASGCSLPPTPASVPLQANLGTKCGDFQACIQNSGTADLIMVIGGPGGVHGFANDANPATTFAAYTQVTLGLTPVNASANGISCNGGILSGQGVNASYIQYMNQEFSDQPVVASGFLAAKARKISSEGADNVTAQLAEGITAWEIDPFNGSILDVETRTMDVNFCSPCNNGDSTNAPVSFQEDCVTYVGVDNGFSYVIKPNTQVTLQFCYVGIADINQYRDCSMPTWSSNGSF